jgi:hypothetical protein
VRVRATLLAAALTGVGLAGIAPSRAPAAAADCTTQTAYNEVGEAYEQVVCDGAGGASTGGGGGGPTYDPDDLVTAVSEVDGQPCTILATPTSDQGEEALAIDAVLGSIPIIGLPLQLIWQTIVAGLPGCPSTVVSPEQVAYSFVREVGAPDPRPAIAPGHAITGKKAFLETPGSVATTVERSTLLGPLVLEFRPTTFTVDWGDGSGVDTFTAPGRPYPSGTATHVYTHTGRYDVVVRQRWDVAWSLAGAGGTLGVTGAPSRIDAFEARELEAVRDR